MREGRCGGRKRVRCKACLRGHMVYLQGIRGLHKFKCSNCTHVVLKATMRPHNAGWLRLVPVEVQ